MFSGTPNLPFAREEHLARQARLRTALGESGFDAILVFAQEAITGSPATTAAASCSSSAPC